ncbi:hypothetical protein LCGC14_0421010 [marine sediment metagenome]|uniref:Uncharacterized protein n=1 Tax=marine sediment metagenome TaxID=412755 RepID=A0A0F9SWX6_9ZZZZ
MGADGTLQIVKRADWNKKWPDVRRLYHRAATMESERLANARLIAAAPDLLEACEKIEAIEKGCLKRRVGYDLQIHSIAKVAIAKAKE